MFGGGALTEVFTLKLFEGRTTESLDPNKLFPKLKDPVGGGGDGGLGPPSKKSSIVGKVGGSPPGPKRFELLLLSLLLLLLLLSLLLLSLFLFLLKYEGFPLSLSSLFRISNSFPCWISNSLSLKEALRDSVSSKCSC